MSLDHQQCYDAMRSRDRRFDGRFWVGVRTTGIYCRPVCPSRTPLARNVDFYAHPAAAEDAGLRPCRRCCPDVAPGSYTWVGAAAVVDRAVRLIEAGALDGGSVADVADRLHIGDRHLRRLFTEHLGTTPDAVARSRRAHLAKRLLCETDLPVGDVAFASGFGSVRQFNDVVRTTFRQTPTELRAGRGRAGDVTARRAEVPLQFRLPARPPFDPDAIMTWFAARAIVGLEVVDGRRHERRIRVDGHVGTLITTADDGGVTVGLDLPVATDLGAIVSGVRRLFDLSADPDAVDAHLATDPALAPRVAARPGIRVPGTWTGFEAAVRAVIGQQISVAAAITVLGRIVAAHGDGAFPTPDAMVDAPLESLGIIGTRAETIRELARRISAGTLALDGAMGHDDLVAELVSVRGIGPWTASYVAMRSGEPDAFPAGDLHLRRALGVTKERDAEHRSQPWRPWRAYAAMHLWQTPGPPLPTQRDEST